MQSDYNILQHSASLILTEEAHFVKIRVKKPSNHSVENYLREV